MVVIIWIGQFLVNLLIILDLTGNVLLLGRPSETISARIARLRLYGGNWSPVGCVLCKLLTKAFWFMHRDHCTWALSGQGTIATELWRWSK